MVAELQTIESSAENWKYLIHPTEKNKNKQIQRIYVPRQIISRTKGHFSKKGKFTFEGIHDTKEQIYFYERAENHKANERMFGLLE